MSRDTFAGKLSTPFSLNRYTYAHDNPIRYWDPTGRCVGDVAVFCSNAQQRQAALATLGVANEFGPTKAKAGLGRLRDQVYVPAKVTGNKSSRPSVTTPASSENTESITINLVNSIPGGCIEQLWDTCINPSGQTGLVSFGELSPVTVVSGVDVKMLESFVNMMQVGDPDAWRPIDLNSYKLAALVFGEAVSSGQVVPNRNAPGYHLASCEGDGWCDVYWHKSIFSELFGYRSTVLDDAVDQHVLLSASLLKWPKPTASVAPGSLVEELAAAGIKHDPANIVRIARDGSGRVVFLETGNSRAGLAHIVGEHADDFAARGVTVNQIPGLVTDAASQGRIVGYQGTGTGRPIYEIVFDGTTQRVAVTVGDNGFIVGANPG